MREQGVRCDGKKDREKGGGRGPRERGGALRKGERGKHVDAIQNVK